MHGNRAAEEQRSRGAKRRGESLQNPGGCDVRGGLGGSVCVCVCGACESSPHAGRPGLSGLDHMCLVWGGKKRTI